MSKLSTKHLPRDQFQTFVRDTVEDIVQGKEYPDILPPQSDQPRGYKRLEHAEGQLKHPPKIVWGPVFQMWDDKQKISWLDRFAAAMNHAADTLQKERNKLIDMGNALAAEVKTLKKQLEAVQRLMQQQIAEANKLAQERVARIQELEAELRGLRAK